MPRSPTTAVLLAQAGLKTVFLSKDIMANLIYTTFNLLQVSSDPSDLLLF